jgi:hypothetical protein
VVVVEDEVEVEGAADLRGTGARMRWFEMGLGAILTYRQVRIGVSSQLLAHKIDEGRLGARPKDKPMR